MPTIASTSASRTASQARAGRLSRCAAGLLALLAIASASSCDPGDVPRTEACDGATLRPVPTDAAERGPWTVGVRTVDVDGLTVEVWYPAGRFAESERRPAFYDVREYLPEEERDRISDADAPFQPCDCYRDVPLDPRHGPYPVVVFLHGQGAFRTQSLPQMLHWASRGFVVLAADHPGVRLADVLPLACGGSPVESDVRGDVEAMIAAVRGHGDAFDFMRGRIDAERVAIAGHSLGGAALAGMGDLAQVLIPMAARGVEPGPALRSTLVLGGTKDAIVPYVQQRRGYFESPAPKRLVGLEDAGHFAFSSICTITNSAGQSLAEIAVESGICGASLLVASMQCNPELLPDPEAWEIIDAVTAAAIEETLHCDPSMAATFDTLREQFSAIAEVRQQL